MRFKDGSSEMWKLSLAPNSTLLGDRYIIATYTPPVEDETWLEQERTKLEQMNHPQLVEESMHVRPRSLFIATFVRRSCYILVT